MALQRRILRSQQNETVYVLNKLYALLSEEQQLMIERDQPNHLYWLLQLLFEQHFQCTFHENGPVRNVYERNLFVEELREFAMQHGMQSSWNIALVSEGKADTSFLAFLEQVLGFLEDDAPFELSE